MLQAFLILPISLNLLFSTPPPRAFSLTAQAGQEIRQEAQVRIQEHKATVAARLTLIRRERVRLYWNRMTARIEALIARLKKLSDRMEARIQKIKDNNEDIDTESAENDIEEAKSLLAEAESELASVESSLEDILSSQEPKEAFSAVIKDVQKIKKDLMEVHSLLVHAIGEIKGLRVGQGTPTPTPNPS